MAYFAHIDKDNKVIRVSSVNDAEVPNEQTGIDFLTNHNKGGWYIQTYIDENQRKNYAGVGYIWDKAKDAFIAPQPYNSWTLNEDTCQWESPVAYPDDGKMYDWDEATTNWEVAIPKE